MLAERLTPSGSGQRDNTHVPINGIAAGDRKSMRRTPLAEKPTNQGEKIE